MTESEAETVVGFICDAWDAASTVRAFIAEFPKHEEAANRAYKEAFGYRLTPKRRMKPKGRTK